MKKLFIFTISLYLIGFSVFAGDVPQFEDLGFSENGKYYAFAQYGREEDTLCAYAEINIISIDDNDFIPNGIMKTEPSKATFNVSPRAVYMDLVNKNRSFIESKGIRIGKVHSKVVYRLPPNSKENTKIEFRDFETSTDPEEIIYTIVLKEKIEGYGEYSISSFFLDLEQRNFENIVMSRTAMGSSRLKKQGVMSYKIYRVFTSPEGGIVAVIVQQENYSNKTGTSIRFNAEALQLGIGR